MNLTEISQLSQLISPLVALGAVYLGSRLTTSRERENREHQKRCIATGFYYEIMDIEKIITPLITKREQSKLTVGYPYMLDQFIHDTKVDLDRFKSLYDKSGLYFQFRKEIYVYDDEIIKNSIIFYQNLLSADRCYQMYYNSLYDIDSEKGADHNMAYKMQDAFFLYLNKSQCVIPSLKRGLQKYATIPDNTTTC